MPHLSHVTPAFRTFSGSGSLAALPKELARLDCRRAVVICGASMLRHAEALQAVESALGERLAGRFSGAAEHSPLPAVQEAAGLLHEVGADAVIAVGGGSAVVTARAATILHGEGGEVRALSTHRGPDGRLVSPRLNAPKLPQWVVATTPTTASAKAGAAVRDPDTGDRLALFDPKARAQGVVFDPLLAATAPAGLVRSSALNAFAMAVDGLQAGSDDPLAEALLARALRMLVTGIPRIDDEAGDELRIDLMLAALLAGQGSDHVGTGLAQAISHAAGPRSRVANGVIEAMLLPHTLRFNESVTGSRLGDVLRGFDRIPPAEGALTPLAAAELETFLGRAGLPARLRDAGIAWESLDDIVEHALQDWSITRVPRPVDRESLGALLADAW